jgi:glutathione peroxidase
LTSKNFLAFKALIILISMKAILAYIFTILGFWGSKQGNLSNYMNISKQSDINSIYKFKVDDINGNPIDLGQFEGKILIIINVASKCGLTPQYEEIESFYRSNKNENIVVLGFPANNFLGQEPGTDQEIEQFCKKNYGVTFPMFSKISVKGNDIHPLYEFLTSKELNGVMDSKVKWNFQKYLVDKEGRVVTYFDPKTSINDSLVVNAIEKIR